MALNKTPVYRNLRTRVTFLYLEYEDLIAVLLIATIAFFVGGVFDRDLFGIPLKFLLQWGIPAITLGDHLKSGQWLSLQNRPTRTTVGTMVFYSFSQC
jgi:hypothetical protein